MKTYYVIQSPTENGYWDRIDKRFRGWLWAAKYKHPEQAKLDYKGTEPFTITEVYE